MNAPNQPAVGFSYLISSTPQMFASPSISSRSQGKFVIVRAIVLEWQINVPPVDTTTSILADDSFVSTNLAELKSGP